MEYAWSYMTFWSWFWFFFLYIPAVILWVWIMIDIVRRPDVNGLGKVGWVLLVIVLPIIGSLIYLAARPSDIIIGKHG